MLLCSAASRWTSPREEEAESLLGKVDGPLELPFGAQSQREVVERRRPRLVVGRGLGQREALLKMLPRRLRARIARRE
jgi:hypothetical protein